MKEQDLRRLLRLQGVPWDRPGRQCPDENAIAAYVDHRLSGRDEARIESHLADCATCLEQVSLLAEPAAGASGPVAVEVLRRARGLVVEAPRRWQPTVLRWGAVAATAACAILAANLHMRAPATPSAAPSSTPGVSAPAAPTLAPTAPPALVEPPGPTPAEPGLAQPPPSAVRRSPRQPLEPDLLSPAEGAMLTRGDLEFRWRPVAGTTFYEIHLVTEDGSVVWSDKVEASHVRPPGGVPLEAGKTYFVWVRAFLSAGGTVKSAAVSFRLAER